MEAEGLLETDTLGVTDGLRDGLKLPESETETLGDLDTEIEAERLGDLDTLTEGDGEADKLADKLAESDPSDGISLQLALVEVPVLKYTFLLSLSRSLNIAPLRKPLYPSGTLFPSASKIRSEVLAAVFVNDVAYRKTRFV